MKNLVGIILLILIFCQGNLCAQQYDEAPSYAEDYAFVTQDGAWCWFSDPRAVYVENKIIGGFVDKQGSIWAFSYDPVNQQKKQYKLKDQLDYDDHSPGQTYYDFLFGTWGNDKFSNLLCND